MPRSPASAALVELRHRAGFTQERLARHLNVTLHSIALWETKRSPSGIVLARLGELADAYAYRDLKDVFEKALVDLPPSRRAISARNAHGGNSWTAA